MSNVQMLDMQLINSVCLMSIRRPFRVQTTTNRPKTSLHDQMVDVTAPRPVPNNDEQSGGRIHPPILHMIALLAALIIQPRCIAFDSTPLSHPLSSQRERRRQLASPPHREGPRTHGARPQLFLNRFLFDHAEVDVFGELDGSEEGSPTVTLGRGDYRTVHAAKILGLRNGGFLRAGIVGGDQEDKNSTYAGLVTDTATVKWLPEGKNVKAEPTRNGEPPGSLRITLDSLAPPPDDAASSSARSVSLLLALPRPLQLGRILPMIAQMGVDRLILTGAKKVPRDYFGSHLFRKPGELRRLLVEGLCQSGDVMLPRATAERSLKRFLEDDLERLFPSSEGALRAFAHPQRSDQPDLPRMRDVEFPPGMNPTNPHVVLAVGPEGGWEEDYEINLLREHGFQQITLGTRVLRSDVAVVSLLALAHDVCAHRATGAAKKCEEQNASETSGESFYAS